MAATSLTEQCPSCGGLHASSELSCGLERDEAGVWSCGASQEPPGFDAAAAGRLSDLVAQGHFWLVGRRRLAERMLATMATARKTPWDHGLDLGCGSGAMLGVLQAGVQSLTGVDGHRSLLHQARQAYPAVRLLEADVTDTGMAAGQFGLIGAFDVLEHVDPDAFLREARRLATDGADFLLSVPAFPSLWSAMDERAGHRCRYRLQKLLVELRRQGWDLVAYTHYQFLLFPLVWLSRHLPFRVVQRVERRPSRGLGRMLGAINTWEVHALGRWPLPWGTSLFIWARARAR